MAQEVRADLLLGRDTLSPGLLKAGRAAADAGGNVKDLQDRLRRLSDRAYDARLGLKGDKEAGQSVDKLTAQLIRLGQRKVDPEIDPEGFLRARAQITGLELALDRLAARKTRVQIAVDKVAGLSFFQPSALGAAVAMLPTLIPLTATVAAGATAIAVSFGAAAAGVAGFGLMAVNVLSTAGEEMKKLQALNLRLNSATTAAQRKTIRQQIADLKSTWAPGFQALISNYQDFQDKWKKISQQITVPTLNVWLPVLTKALSFLKPLIKPIADAFTLWGISLNTYFKDPAAAKHIKDMAAAFGNFAAQQLFRIGQFIKDIGQGVFNLGKDLASSGANFNSFGTWLSNIGDGFLTWSKSDAARKDVHGFMKFIHDEGPVVKGILKDLGTLLPGVFAGATTVGTLELQALADFLNLVAKLPKGWQKGLTEAVGALLLLNKLGVVKVGLKLTGWSLAGSAAGGAAEGAGAVGAGGTLAALQRSTGLKWAWRAGIAVALTELLVKPVLQSQSSGKGKNWWDNPFGTDKGRGALNSWKTLFHDIEHIFDTGRHWIAASWDASWQDTIGKAIRAGATLRHDIASTGHDIAHTFDVTRHGIATAWDATWRNTVGRAQGGISDVVRYVRTMEPRILGALWGLGHALYAKAHAAFNEFLDGARTVAGNILGWLGGFVGKIVGLVGKLLRLGSPSGVFFDIGKNMMLGLEKGIRAHAHKAANAARSAAMSTTAAGQAGGGVQRWRPLVLRALRMEGLSAGLVNDVLYQMQTESGGNPRAINLSDINAQMGTPSKGLMQVIQPTFDYWHWPGTSWNIYNPLANIAAALNYAAHGKGFGSGIGQIGSGHGYDSGGWLPPGLSLALNRTGAPERVLSPAEMRRSPSGRARVVLQIHPTGTSAFDRFMADWLANAARVRGGGSLELAFGAHH